MSATSLVSPSAAALVKKRDGYQLIVQKCLTIYSVLKPALDLCLSSGDSSSNRDVSFYISPSEIAFNRYIY